MFDAGLRADRRGAARRGRHRDVRRQGGGPRAGRALRRDRGPRGAHAVAHDLGRPDPRRPGQRRASCCTRSPSCRSRGDPIPRCELLLRMLGENGDVIPPGELPLHRRALRPRSRRSTAGSSRGRSSCSAEQQAAGREVVLCVNLSAKSVTDPRLPEHIASELQAHGADGRGLCFEVTETAAVVNIDRARQFAQPRRRAGLRVRPRRLRRRLRLLLLPQAPRLRPAQDRRRVRHGPADQPDQPARGQGGRRHRPRARQADDRRVRRGRGDARAAARDGRGLRPGLLHRQAGAATASSSRRSHISRTPSGSNPSFS